MEPLLSELKKFGIDPQSYLLLKKGYKPVIRVMLREEIAKDFKNYFQKLGFSVLVKKFKELYGEKLNHPSYLIYLSTTKELSKKAWGAERNQDRKSLGKLLGYPKCCVEEFIKSFGNNDLMINSFKNTKRKPSFYCNSLFNFDSKLDVRNLKIYQENFDIFKRYENLFLIRHVPCSLDCQESIKIGKKTLKILKRELPQLAEKIVYALKKPALYFDYFRWVLFEGEVKENELTYEKVLPYKSLFPQEKIEIIKKGDRIKVSKEKVQVFQEENLLLEIPKKENKGILIDFS